MGKFWIGLQMAGLLCLSASVVPARAARSDHEGLVYAGSFAGVKVLDLTAGVDLRPDGYQVGIDFRTTGAIDLLMHSQVRSLVDGVWQGGHAAPTRYVSTGVLRGRQRRVEIVYPDGQPHIATLDPPVEADREPVPPQMQRDTMDGLSALASLLQNVANTGGCDGEVTTFDGRIVSLVKAHSGGQETLPAQSDLAYHGPALRCDITTTPLAGFPKDSEPGDAQRRPRQSSVWLAQIRDGGPLVPVLIEVELRIAGHMTLRLVNAQS